jgi:putative hydrolase of the HAD superfamily
MIQTVLFDMGGVLIHIAPDAFSVALDIQKDELQSDLAHAIRSWAVRYERGDCTTQEFFTTVVRLSHNRFSLKQVEDAYMCILREPMEGMAELVRRVSASYRTALVSNTSEIHYRYCSVFLEALHILPVHYVSYKLNALKPHPEFYQTVLCDLPHAAGDAVFIDDTPENVQGASAAGMHGVLFHSAKALNTSLSTLGVRS